ncbi:hypothetical protein CesoFtcFv8_011120 [Champsocephalus esox]|uniref:Uncharacterized protein n=1 Tax=Champsocephalus esox TaxID=159716 RepID=A0AAN8GXR1_9TELE|nr:hypothetical protein CesoFtcFv8_011120 [Champsocephalus esox]
MPQNVILCEPLYFNMMKSAACGEGQQGICSGAYCAREWDRQKEVCKKRRLNESRYVKGERERQGKGGKEEKVRHRA